MGFICHHFLFHLPPFSWVWSKDTMFGFFVPHREKLCVIVRVKLHYLLSGTLGVLIRKPLPWFKVLPKLDT
jgi:hypothetical protein